MKRKDDRVFAALADPNRRRVLDLLRRSPGATASSLASRFAFSRIALVKHLRVLEDGGLITRRRVGRSVELFVDEGPMSEVLSRRLAECSPLWVEKLGNLKAQLEKETVPMTGAPRHVYVVYIRTTPEKLWEALTRPEMTRRYFFGTDVSDGLAPGAPISYSLKDPAGRVRVAVSGEVIECVPGRRLVHTFRFTGLPDQPTRVSYEIEPAAPGTVRLTLTHEGFDGETPTWREVGGGWPRVVSALKTLLETGEDLETEEETNS